MFARTSSTRRNASLRDTVSFFQTKSTLDAIVILDLEQYFFCFYPSRITSFLLLSSSLWYLSYFEYFFSATNLKYLLASTKKFSIKHFIMGAPSFVIFSRISTLLFLCLNIISVSSWLKFWWWLIRNVMRVEGMERD